MKKLVILILIGVIIASCVSNHNDGKAVYDAIHKNNITALKKLITQRNINSAVYKDDAPLVIAAKAGKIKVVKFLLDNGADVNKKNKYSKSVLFYPFRKKLLDIPKLLISCGANVNIRDNYNATPLMSACSILKKGEPAFTYHPYIEFLVKNGAKLDAKNMAGETALFYAIRAGRIENVRLLLALGARKNARNNRGLTPVMCAENIMIGYQRAAAAFR